MKIQNVIEKFLEEESLVVDGKTFFPNRLEEIQLETGENFYWIEDEGDAWLSIDPESEEVILFHKLDEEIDSSGETTFYNGTDYEFEFETVAYAMDEGEKSEKLLFKDFENNGETLRVIENTVTNDVESSLGKKITEDDFQEE